ncbi:hypothetical protein [Desulfoplanes formicivorans]|nr:hypothetical protein [Desulfoplanes formicivorans]
MGHARDLCRGLMLELEQTKRIDWHVPPKQADPRLTTDYLFGPARGQMFGVMEYVDDRGQVGCAKAFSGQYNGIWHVDGWVGPLVDTSEMDRISRPVERTIKELGRTIAGLSDDDPLRRDLVNKRRALSKGLMKKIHGLYTVSNFRGETRLMADVFEGPGGMPTGTGDCCAPKLLNHAVHNQWIPLGIAEFYWGLENRSGSKKHGRFYPACTEKCQPILGFMLCGLADK